MAKKKTDEKNIHAGHRARLLALAYRVGLENLTPIQIVEVFLFFIFPRGDVNPLAHRLLDTYGDLTHIVEADINDLKTVAGVNELTALKIVVFGGLFYAFVTEKMATKTQITTRAELLDVIDDLLRFRATENMVLIGLSPANIIQSTKRIASASTNEVSLSNLQLTNFLASNKPASLVVAHSHPYGLCKPSPSDGDAYKMIEQICFNCGVRFLDSFIVGEDGIYSQKDGQKARIYQDVKELKNIFEGE